MAFRPGPVARPGEAPPGNWMGDEAALCRVAAAPYPAYRMAFRPGPVARLSEAPPGNWMGDEAALCRVAASPYPAYRMAFWPGPVARLSEAPPGWGWINGWCRVASTRWEQKR
ncbi:TPA: hypothetical protein RFT61_002344 [Klebsiella aerogenes]|nr:hypothetical protein [Klebsiella aerogenes]